MISLKNENTGNLVTHSRKYVPMVQINNETAFGLGTGLNQNSQQTIILTNDGSHYWRKYESLGLDEFT